MCGMLWGEYRLTLYCPSPPCPQTMGSYGLQVLSSPACCLWGASVFFCVSSTTMSTCLLHVVGDTSLYVYSPQLISTYW